MDALPGKTIRFTKEENGRNALCERAFLYWTSEDWSKVLFSDEPKFKKLGSDGPRYVRRRPCGEFDPKCISSTVKGGAGSVMGQEHIFQHDNDPKHISALVETWLSSEIVEELEWPAQSPDLHPIENPWIDLNEATKRKKLKDIKELYDTIENAWHDIPTECCQKLVDSMPRRCAAVIKSGGYPIKY
ncbi:hypothetical protein ANCCAN_25075 [Ancylostoma caninum]|uniref:Tc1-like transposase DDE domain-containing protein n=1 Tax=Ancylostoma caninum TaxID=29170 RepID=A0A368FAF4_ANCCA|nr:hypothetical protein ANCCAN_25075 [Ancylostoma caninum]